MIYLIFSFILFETLLAIITQALGIFYFWVIFLINLSGVLAIVFYIFKKRKKIEIKVDWMAVFVFLISFLCLFQVHYNYTGKINFATDQNISYHDVKNMVYPYPYFSDEWDAVSMINYSIDSHKLPLINPLDNNSYINFAVPYFSFLSVLALILKVNPLFAFNFFAIFINILIILITYLFLRINKMPKAVSAISALSLLYITSAANLPGIWHLIPVHLGIVFCLLGFCFMSLNKKNLSILSGISVLLFYPPLILFYGLALAVFLAPVISQRYGIISVMTGRLFYPSFSGNFIPQYNFYNVIPLFNLLFFPFGIYYVFKNLKWLFSQIILGACFWILYSFVSFRIIIDYERIVFFTSIIAVIVSGFGLNIIFNYFNKKYLGLIILAAFVFITPFYTLQNHWEKFVLVEASNGAKSYPKAPANNYITEEDIEIFRDIKQKKFLSIPWKGLVIGIATKNYPAVAKEGIISVGSIQTINQFLQADCKGKLNLAKKQKLDYIYLYQFDCPGFEKIRQSSEKFVLYKVQ